MAQSPITSSTQLYLILELGRGAPPVERLTPILDGDRVPSLLLVPSAERALDPSSLQALVAVAQHAGVAVLIAGYIKLAAEVGADGVHISARDLDGSALERYRSAREKLGANAIIGVDAGRSRHDAMALAEAGADYIAFGKVSDQSGSTEHNDGPKTPIEAQLDIVAWWSDIFEVPVVAFDVDDDETSRSLAEAGADFVARKIPVATSTADLRDWLENAEEAIASDQGAT